MPKKLVLKKHRGVKAPVLRKSPTGIAGLDEVTHGGLPAGRPTLICGGAGAGKTLFGLEFLVRGITQFNEPGVFVAFEETEKDLAENVSSLGFNLRDLEAQKKLVVDHIRVERSEISETGDYDLEGLFIRLGYAIDSIKAKRIVLDTLEALFTGLSNEVILRSELRRLFRWLKDKGVTAIITGERGTGALTRYGLEEYVADCVILLDHRVEGQLSTRRLRIVKYRGSEHGTNEYPFLIGKHGISVLPITSLGLDHPASSQRISTGVSRLDTMFGGKGYFRGSTILVSGTAGTGKSSLAAAFAKSACDRGERCLYVALEESPSQIIRNMSSIGMDLSGAVKKGLLQFHASRSSVYGLEMHLVALHELIERFKPSVVIVDPITNLLSSGDENQVKSMLTRLIDSLKVRQLTALFTSLTSGDITVAENSEAGISSLMDTWILLRNMEYGGERNRVIHVLKSRGMAHSNQVREFHLTSKGISLADVYVGTGQVLTGTAREIQEARDKAQQVAREQEISRLLRAAEHKKLAVEAQVKALQTSLESDLDELDKTLREQKLLGNAEEHDRAASARARMADNTPSSKSVGKSNSVTHNSR